MNADEEIGKSKTVYRDHNLQVVFGVTIVSAIGIFSLSPAFPRIALDLGLSSSKVGLLITVFTLPGFILMSVMGIFADMFGRKKVLIPSVLLFGVAGISCFFVRDFRVLLMLRFLQGIGAAPLSSLNVTIIGDLYTGQERMAAMEYNQCVFSVGAAGFEAIGGALAMLGWHYPFLLPLLAIPVGFLIMFWLKNPEPKQFKMFSEYRRNAIKSVRQVQTVGIYAATIIIFILLSGAYFNYLPLLMGLTFEVPTVYIGIVMSGMTIASAVSSSQMDRLTRLVPEKVVFKVAVLLYALALLIIPFIHNVWLFFVPTIVFGLAQGIA